MRFSNIQSILALVAAHAWYTAGQDSYGGSHGGGYGSGYGTYGQSGQSAASPASSVAAQQAEVSPVTMASYMTSMSMPNSASPTMGLAASAMPTQSGGIPVQVVQVSNTGKAIKYFPDNIQAAPGSVVQFQFVAGVSGAHICDHTKLT